MSSSANKTSRAYGQLIDRLRTASPTYVATSGNYGRPSAHNFGPCPVRRMHVCLTHHSHTDAR